MPTHRLDIGLKGMSHYVDDQLHGTSELTRFPPGLHLDRKAGRRAPKEKILVRKPGIGRSIEWKSNGISGGSQSDEHRGGPPPRPPRGRPPGPQPGRRGEQQREDPEQVPGLFDVPDGEDEGEDEGENEGENEGGNEDEPAQSQALSRRAHSGTVHFQNHSRHRQKKHGSDRSMSTMGFDPFEMCRERPPPGLGFVQMLDWERDHGGASSHGYTGHTGRHNCSTRTTRATSLAPAHSRWLERPERQEQELRHRPWR